MNKPYQPANGSEGELFMEKFCYQCLHDEKFRKTEDSNDACEIIIMTMNYSPEEEGYPRQWIIGEEGPTCTKFRHEDDKPAPAPPPRCKHTQEMF